MTSRTEEQVEYDRHFVVAKRMTGHTFREISAMLENETGRYVSAPTLSKDMLAVRQQWAEEHPGEVHELLNGELARLDEMEKVAWKKFYEAEGNTKEVKRVLERRMAFRTDELTQEQEPVEWEDFKEVITVEDMGQQERFWWQEITKIQQDRRKLLNLYKENIDVQFGISGQVVVKGYMDWSPDKAWPDSPRLQDGETVEGEYIDKTVQRQSGNSQPE